MEKVTKPEAVTEEMSPVDRLLKLVKVTKPTKVIMAEQEQNQVVQAPAEVGVELDELLEKIATSPYPEFELFPYFEKVRAKKLGIIPINQNFDLKGFSDVLRIDIEPSFYNDMVFTIYFSDKRAVFSVLEGDKNIWYAILEAAPKDPDVVISYFSVETSTQEVIETIQLLKDVIVGYKEEI
ncbi:MAG: hypothetical protein ACE5K8_09725, partial [Candidatus Zixiibacteriota bacterium]